MIRILAFSASLCAALARPAAADGAPSCPTSKDVAFLQGLNREGEYRLAALQGELYLRRAEGASAEDSCAVPTGILLETGKALYHLGEFARVRQAFRARALEADPSHRRYWMESHFLQLERPDLADSALAWLGGLEAREALAEKERALYRAEALHLLERTREAREDWRVSGAPASVLGCGAGAGDPAAWFDKGYLSPGVATGLSVFPGGGYFYAGQAGDGWAALVAVTALYGVSALYAWNDAPLRSVAAAGLGGAFHVSSIYGGRRAAVEANRNRKRSFLRDMHPCLP